MISEEKVEQFSTAVRNELDKNLVPFWLERAVDAERSRSTEGTDFERQNPLDLLGTVSIQ